MVSATETNLAGAGIDDNPAVVLADAGYCSEDNLAKAAGGETDVLIATGRLKHNIARCRSSARATSRR
jgi:hypothetical protein